MADDEVSLETSHADQEETSGEAPSSPQPALADNLDPETAVVNRDSIENADEDERREIIDEKEVVKDEEVEKKEEPATMGAGKIETTSVQNETTSVKNETTSVQNETTSVQNETTSAKDEETTAMKDEAKEEDVEKTIPVVNGETGENDHGEDDEEENDVCFKSHRRHRGTGSSSDEEEVEQQQQEEGDQREEGAVTDEEEGAVTEEEEGAVTEEAESDNGWEEEEEKKSPEADGSGSNEEEETISKKDPMFVPRGRYFLHDNREQNDEDQAVVEISKAPTRSEIVDKWEHDLYVESEQVPRTPEEKRRDRIFYESRGRTKDHEDSCDNRRGVPLRQFFPPERRDRSHQSNRDRRKLSSERDEGTRSGQDRTEYNDRQRNENDERRSEYRGQQQRGGYRDGGYQSNRQPRDYNDMRQTNRHRWEKWNEIDQVRTKGRREVSKQENHKEYGDENSKQEPRVSKDETSGQEATVGEGQKSEDDESRVSRSNKLAVDEPVKKQSSSPLKHSDKSSSQSKSSPKSLFHQNSAAPMPSRVFTLGKHSDLIVRDVSSKMAGQAGARRAVGRGRGRGRGIVTARQQTVPGGGTKVLEPFSTASSTTATTVIESSTYTLKSDARSVSPVDQDATDAPPTKEPTDEAATASTKPSETVTDKNSPSQTAKTTSSILGSPPLESKPKRYSSRRQKGGGAVPLTATPTSNYTENVNDEGQQSAAAMPLPGGMSPWVQPVPIDHAMFQRQQAMWAAFMQQMMYQQQHMMMSGAYPPHPGVPPGPPPPMMEQYIEPATAQQLAAYTPPPPGPRGVFIPGMDNSSEQGQRNTQQKPNQAIPIVSPDEK